MKTRYLTITLLSTAIVIALGLANGCGQDAGAEGKGKVVIGGKDFTEQKLLSHMAGALLENAGFEVEIKGGVGSNVARQALTNDQTDLYYEYTGTAYVTYHEQDDSEVMRDPEKVYQWVKEKDAAEEDLAWLRSRFDGGR